MAHRELGELHLARSELEHAWESAIALDDPVLAGRIAITLALVVAYQGDLKDALAILDLSEPGLTGEARGRLRTQRGHHPVATGSLRTCARGVRRRPRDVDGERRHARRAASADQHRGAAQLPRPARGGPFAPRDRRRPSRGARPDVAARCRPAEPRLHRRADRGPPGRLRVVRAGRRVLHQLRLRRSDGAFAPTGSRAGPAAGQPPRRGAGGRRSRRRGGGADRGRPRRRREPARRRGGPSGQRRRRGWGRGSRGKRRSVHRSGASGMGGARSLGRAAGTGGRPSDIGSRRRVGRQRRRARVVRLPHGGLAGDAAGGGGPCRAERRRGCGRAHEVGRQVGPGVGRPPACRAARPCHDRGRPRQAGQRAAGREPRRAHPPRAPCRARRHRAARPRRRQQRRSGQDRRAPGGRRRTSSGAVDPPRGDSPHHVVDAGRSAAR